MIRDTAHAYAQDKLQPRVTEAYLNEKTDPAIFREMGELGLLGVTVPEEYGGVGASYVAYGLVAREVERGRLRLSLDDVRAILARHVSDPHLRLGRAAPEISAEARVGRMDRLLRPDRAGRRLRPRRHEDARGKGRRRLSPDRLEDVDLQRADRRRVRGLGEVGGPRRRDPRLRAGKGHEGPVARQRSAASSRCAPRSPARS